MANRAYPLTRALNKCIWEIEGVPAQEIAVRLAVMDAEEEMRDRLFLTKIVLSMFRFVPAVRRLLQRWETYEKAYIQSAKEEAASRGPLWR